MDGGPVFKWRVVDAWHEPDGEYWFGRHGNFLTWRDIAAAQPDSPLGRWVLQLRDWGFNALCFFYDPETNPAAVGNFARFLRAQGMGLLVRRDWNETETGRSWPMSFGRAQARVSRRLCPYDAEVRQYWEQRVARDVDLIPGLAGYYTAPTQFYYRAGAPWMCACDECRPKHPRTRLIDAIRLLAGLLGAHGKSLFWESGQDEPIGHRLEVHYFRDLAGELPDNAHVLVHRTYAQFPPPNPRHPLFDVMRVNANGRSPYLTSTLQAPGEYQGVHDFPWCNVDAWSAAFRDMLATGQQGFWVTAMVHPHGWDHPLNLANWYALARFMREPAADPVQVKLDWARERFGEEAAPVVVAVLDRVTRAAIGTFMCHGLWNANHSRYPYLEYLDSHLCGPWRHAARMDGLMGLIFPLDMYSPEREAEIRAMPASRLVFNQFPITPALKAEALAEKDGALRLMEEAIALWRSLAGVVAEQDYALILDGLERNRDDVAIFRHTLDLYFDLKLGVLTEAEIDAVLVASAGLHGACVPNPLDPDPPWPTVSEKGASLKTLAEQLRQELRTPWLEQYWREHPLGAGVTEP